MKTVIAILLLICLVNSHEFKADTKVTILNEQNFADHVSTGNWLLLLYAPWCGHCKRLIPTWDLLPEALAPEGVKVGAVQCDENQNLCGEFAIRGMLSYPMIRYIDHARDVFVHKGNRNLDDFLKFVRTEYKNAEEKQSYPSKYYKPSTDL